MNVHRFPTLATNPSRHGHTIPALVVHTEIEQLAQLDPDLYRVACEFVHGLHQRACADAEPLEHTRS